MTERVKLGELLVETGLIGREQLDEALARQKVDKRRLGEILVDSGVVTESKVTQVLSQQLSVPWVSLEHIDFSRQLLNLVSADAAEKHNLVPIYVRRSKKRQQTLYVAMEDPSDAVALAEVEAYAGLPVRPMIAPPSDIRGAIRAYYLGIPPEEGQTELQQEARPAAAKLPPPPRSPQVAAEPEAVQAQPAAVQTPSEAVQTPKPAADGASPESAPESGPVRVRDSAMPQPKEPEGPKMVTLTMLDGTQITLPAKKTKEKVSAGDLTARDLVEALRAQAEGKDMSEVLGKDVNWEKMFAALLSLMLKKHLILDWEFVRELKR